MTHGTYDAVGAGLRWALTGAVRLSELGEAAANSTDAKATRDTMRCDAIESARAEEEG